jgi:hypothetical protein
MFRIGVFPPYGCVFDGCVIIFRRFSAGLLPRFVFNSLLSAVKIKAKYLLTVRDQTASLAAVIFHDSWAVLSLHNSAGSRTLKLTEPKELKVFRNVVVMDMVAAHNQAAAILSAFSPPDEQQRFTALAIDLFVQMTAGCTSGATIHSRERQPSSPHTSAYRIECYRVIRASTTSLDGVAGD